MDLITPSFGIIFWQTITFGCVLFILRKFAWKPIIAIIKSREAALSKAMQSLENARQDADRIIKNNEESVKKVSLESDKIIKEALDIRDKILNEASSNAQKISDDLIASAKDEIEKEKKAVMLNMKSHILAMSVKMAETLIRKELDNDYEQQKLLDNILNEH